MKLFLVIFGLLFINSVFATSATDVKEKATATVDTAGNYTKEQKEAFVKEMDQNLATLRSRIKEMKTNADSAANQNLAILEKKQKDLEHGISSLKKSGDNAWGKLHTGVSKAWDDIKKSMSEASDEVKK